MNDTSNQSSNNMENNPSTNHVSNEQNIPANNMNSQNSQNISVNNNNIQNSQNIPVNNNNFQNSQNIPANNMNFQNPQNNPVNNNNFQNPQNIPANNMNFQNSQNIPANNNFNFQNNQSQQNPDYYYPKYTPKGIRLPRHLGDIYKSFSYYITLSVLYGLFFSFCFFKNWSGITSILFFAGTIAVIHKLVKRWGLHYDNWIKLSEILLVLLGVSNAITQNGFILFFNYVFGFALLLFIVIQSIFDMKQWRLYQLIISSIQIGCKTLENGFNISKNSKIHKEMFNDGNPPKKFLSNPKVRFVGIGFLFGIPATLFVLNLLASSDAVFGALYYKTIQSIFGEYVLLNLILIILQATVVMLLTYGLLCTWEYLHLDKQQPKTQKKMDALIAITFSSMLLFVYVIYCYVQVGALFLGAMELPQNYTYAEYAREGFFELLVVSILNFILAIVAIELFTKSKALNIILTLISSCTYIMLISACYRLGMYINMYGLTNSRVLAGWMLGVLALLFVIVLLYIWKSETKIIRLSVATITICYLALSFSHMDYWIADYNLNSNIFVINSYINGRSDEARLEYCVCDLSIDAAPAISEYFEKKETLTDEEKRIKDIFITDVDDAYDDMLLRNINLSKIIAHYSQRN